MLTNAEQQWVLLQSLKVIDRSPHAEDRLDKPRVLIMEELGKFGHVAAIPALVAIIRDPSDIYRAYAVRALSAIPHTRAIEELIHILKDSQMAPHAHEQLMKVTDTRVGWNNPLYLPATAEGRSRLQRVWTKWWRENRQKAKLRPQAAWGWDGYPTGDDPTDDPHYLDDEPNE